MAERLRMELISLSNLSYTNMNRHLLAKGVITDDEKEEFDNRTINSQQMDRVISIVRNSLKLNHTMKFKGFLEALEQCGDLTSKEIARQLGK